MGGVLNSVNSVVHGLTGIDLTGGYAAQQGMQAQQKAASDANQVQWNMFQQQQANQKPYLQAGTNALTQLQNNMGSYNQPFTMAQFQQDPGYQFALQQGQQAIQRSSAVNGGLVSGGQLAALNNYSQGMANQEFNDAFNRYQQQNQNSFNRLYSMAGLGQGAVQNVGQMGANTANAVGENMMGAANAQAAYGQQQQGMTMSMLGMGAGLYGASLMGGKKG